MANREVYLTTTDNPYDPKENFNEWYAYDTSKGYDTCGYLARIAKTSEGNSDLDNDQEIERAIDEILEFNLLGNYKKIVYENGKLLAS